MWSQKCGILIFIVQCFFSLFGDNNKFDSEINLFETIYKAKMVVRKPCLSEQYFGLKNHQRFETQNDTKYNNKPMKNSPIVKNDGWYMIV